MTEDTNDHRGNHPTTPNEKPLEGWKEIASHLQRGVRTAKRWEIDEALPVHRHEHQARASVYAYPSELETWRENRKPGAAAMSGWLWQRPARAVAMTVVVLLAVVTMGSGPITSAATGDPGSGMTTRRVWTGPGAGVPVMPTIDGRYFTYLDNSTGDLAIRDMETGESRHLTNKGGWSKSNYYALLSTVSPDGQQVAYAWQDDIKSPELRLIGIAGGESRLLHSSDEVTYIEPHGWSPDGAEVLVEFWMADQSTQIAFIGVADGTVRVLKTTDWRHPFRPALSPNGRFILLDFPPLEDSDKRDIFMLSADGSREVPLVEHPANDHHPLWIPDGGTVLFVSDRTGSPALWSLRVADGQPQGSPELVKRDMGMFYPLRVTRSGALYYTLRTGMRDIYFTRFDSETGKRLTAPAKPPLKYEGSNSSPRWSPDGKSLAYFSRRGLSGLRPTVVVREIESGDEREYSPPLMQIAKMTSWSRDGRSLLLFAADLRRRIGLFRLDLESGSLGPRLLEYGKAALRQAILSADGKTLYHAAFINKKTEPGMRAECEGARQAIVARDLPTGSDKVIFCAPVRIFGLNLSPDEKVLAFTFLTGQPSQPSNTINLLTVETGEVRPLLEVPENAVPLAWSPDGKNLYFRRDSRPVAGEAEEHTHQLWRIPVDGGEPQRLDLGIGDTRVHEISIHPNGRQAAFAAGGEQKSEIWALENFLPPAEVAREEQ